MKKMGKDRRKRRGVSYAKRVADINRVYDEHVRSGLSNREIWRRWIYPRFGISERTLYNMLKAPSRPSTSIPKDMQLYLDFED
jgi:hypothetical protein